MIDSLGLLYNNNIIVNDNISIHIPTIREICEIGEEKYYSAISTLCSSPYDYMVFLHDKLNIDYMDVSDFEMFLMFYKVIDPDVIKLILCGIDFKLFDVVKNDAVNNFVICDKKSKIIIDETLYMLIVSYIRKIHMMERKNDLPGSRDTYNYLLEKERRKLRYNHHKNFESLLSPLISSMVNTSDFKYDYSSVWDLNIYLFMSSVQRISKKENAGYVMQGIYTGNIDAKKISSDAINWMSKIN